MVDVSRKPEVFREAVASGVIRLRAETVQRIRRGHVAKGDVFTVAKVAGILAAKKTSFLVPLCHPLPLTNVDVKVKVLDDVRVGVEANVRTCGRTGVEMEALVAVCGGLLTVWDMVKEYEKDEKGQYPVASIKDVKVVKKEKESA
ncbi:MAG: cyclic pyranopterin monophosphate synthase MoaC [Thermoproteota archaeon]|nr:cyclic pyranopterin monophosphate synthase MoaC [Thermoproteota archaeon]